MRLVNFPGLSETYGGIAVSIGTYVPRWRDGSDWTGLARDRTQGVVGIIRKLVLGRIEISRGGSDNRFWGNEIEQSEFTEEFQTMKGPPCSGIPIGRKGSTI